MSSFREIEPPPEERGPWIVFARVEGARDTRYGRDFPTPAKAWKCICQIAQEIAESPGESLLRPGETLTLGVINLALPTNVPVMMIDLTATSSTRGVTIRETLYWNFSPWEPLLSADLALLDETG